ncbi:MAG: alpha-glucuronidase [Blautia sp.]|nr:alpha-glucuronidase [Blautia sp.]
MSEAWKKRRAWLSALKWELPENLETPAQAAAFEGEHFLAPRNEKPELEEDAGLGEAYEITSQGETWRIRGGRTGLLYGVYALIRCLLTAGKIPEGICSPYYPLRMLNAWDNMSGDIERGYAGRSLWFEGGEFRYEPDRIRQLGRMLAFAGINVLCINNVNVHAPAQGLADEWLPDVEAFARILRPFGVRLMLSIDFSMPLQRGLETADPLDPRVQEWWRQQADRIWETVPDLAGFLVKADSEHRPGPNAYGRTHADGANMLARAVAPYGGVLVWRAFVYDCMQDWRDTHTDRPCAAYDLYHPMDGDFDENVILQVKNGPYDFQVREPVSPLFFGMPHTRLALELQLAQEYTGQQVDLYAMPPMWREIFDQIGKEKAQAIAAVTNLGRDDNWTGHPMAALNLYAFGRYAWDPDLEPEAVIREWVRLTYELKPEQENVLERILLKSRSVYEKYTSPLGLCWMVNPAYHYGPSPYGYEFQAWGTYNRADRDAVGIDRTSAGTGYTGQYPPALRDLFENKDTCPENLLLFFHRLPYTWRMRDGRTLIQRIYDDHFEGYDEAEKMKEELETLGLPAVDAAEVIERAERQLQNAREWRDVINTFFHRLSGVPDEKGRKIYL